MRAEWAYPSTQLFGTPCILRRDAKAKAPFDRGLRADGHEYRRFDGPVRRMEQSRTGVRAFGDCFEGDLGQLKAYRYYDSRLAGVPGGGQGWWRFDAKPGSRAYFSRRRGRFGTPTWREDWYNCWW